MSKKAKNNLMANLPKLSNRDGKSSEILLGDDDKAEQFINQAPVQIKSPAPPKQIKVPQKVASFNIPSTILESLDRYVATMHFKKGVKVNKSDFVAKAISAQLESGSKDPVD